MANDELDKFRNLRFEDFGRMARDPSLKPHEKVGFPSVFREGHDLEIFADIAAKTEWKKAHKILDIGCGCGELVKYMIAATEAGQRLVLNDSSEVLSEIPEHKYIIKMPGRFPDSVSMKGEAGSFDIIISYSVFHYVFMDGDPLEFIGQALALLRPGGRFLLGDIPNVSKRNRFLSTPEGVEFHKKLMGTDQAPEISPVEPGRIDDGYIMGLLTKFRSSDIETHLLQQPVTLPLSNSREDILFIRR